MIKKDVIGYASFIARTISRPQVVILIPQASRNFHGSAATFKVSLTLAWMFGAQAEKLNAAGVAYQPNGIHVCQLPFADDIRDIAVDSTISVLRKPSAFSASFCTFVELMNAVTAEEDEDPEQPEVDQAKKIIKYFAKPYNPDVYPNPGARRTRVNTCASC